MYHVYVLKCYNHHGKVIYYTGYTNNINRRIHEHLTGKSRYTKQFKGKIQLVAMKEFRSRQSAISCERKLKHDQGEKIKFINDNKTCID